MIHNLLLWIFNLSSACLILSNFANCQIINNDINTKESFPVIGETLALNFPSDHGTHNEYRIEWWYLTSNLKDQHGNAFGVQWTLFRVAFEPKPDKDKWNSSQIWMGHAAITGKNFHMFEEKLARGGVSQANVLTRPFEAWIDDWYLKGADWSDLSVSAGGENFRYTINLQAQGPIVKHGDEGRSVKSDLGQASAYYSQPFFLAEGWIEQNNQRIQVTGSAWADHEWSSQFISNSQQGWDWFSLNLDAGEKLMLFQVRENDGNHFYSGTWIDPEGNYQSLDPTSIRIEPIEITRFNEYYTDWHVSIEDFDFHVKVSALNPNSKMDTVYPYWEGPITFDGSHSGNGYLEMTGYVD